MKTARLLLLAMLLASSVTARKIWVFIGQVSNTMDVYKVYVYPDYGFDSTLIFKRDFDCTPQKNCRYDPTPQTMTYAGQTIVYYDAYTQMNLLSQALSEQVHFRYAIDSVPGIPSVIGFSRDSEFLTYLAQQNYQKGRKLIFQMDWEHNILIKGDITRNDKLPVDIDMTGTIISFSQPKFKTNGLKVCFTNMLDLLDGVPSMIGVKKSEFDNWKSFINESMYLADQKGNVLMFNLSIFLYDQQGTSIGNLDFKVDEFIGDYGQLLVKPFTESFDQGRGCDIYIGSALMRRHLFNYYYREIGNGKFESLWHYDGFQGYKQDTRIRKISHFEKDLIYFSVGFLVACFLLYKYLLKNQSDSWEDNEDTESAKHAYEMEVAKLRTQNFAPNLKGEEV
jgi:hypothetical protein